MPAATQKPLELQLKKLEKASIKPKFLEPLDRIIFAILTDCGTMPVDAEKAIRRVQTAFIDWNEVRVSRWVEIARAFDPIPSADAAAIRTRDMLNRLFDLRGELTTDFFITLKLNEARKALVEIDPDFPKDQIQTILFQCMPGMTPPVTPEILQAAKKYEVVSKNGTKEQLQKLMTDDPENGIKVFHYLEMTLLEERLATIGESAKTRASARMAARKKDSVRIQPKKQ